MIAIPAKLCSDFILIPGTAIHIALEHTIHFAGIRSYEVVAGNQADTESWLPALQHHQECFGKPPEMAAADRGFFSAQNERAVVKKVVFG